MEETRAEQITRNLDEIEAVYRKNGWPDFKGVAGRLSSSASGWRPIETAPKDGTNFLACDVDDVYSNCFIAFWSDFMNEFRDGSSHLLVEPTHWMPLPAMPKSDLGQ